MTAENRPLRSKPPAGVDECYGDISPTESVILLGVRRIAPFMTRLLAWLASIRRSGSLFDSPALLD